jgi:hypothetical protein
MTQTRTGVAAHTEALRAQNEDLFAAGPAATAAAAAAGDWDTAVALADRLRTAGRHQHTTVVADALTAGLDWWQLSTLLRSHPQAAFEEYGNVIEGLPLPAEQRPDLAVVCTAGLAALHGMQPEYGIDLDDLGADHSLTTDPTVVRLRAAAELLGDDIWIAVTLPGSHYGAEGAPADDQAITQWTTVTARPDDLTWLREALTLNTEDHDTEDPDPLD